MPEVPSTTPEEKQLPDNLYELKRVWAGLSFPQKVVAIGRIWDSKKNIGKDEFTIKAVRILKCDITAFKAMLDTYEEYGEAVLIEPEPEEELSPKPAPIPKHEPGNKKGVLTNLLHQPLSVRGAKKLYEELKEDWAKWSILRRSVQLKRLFDFELDHTPDDEARIFVKFCKKIGFLSREDVTGYLELTKQSAGLKTITNKEILDEETVRLIGAMRIQFGNLFDAKKIAYEIGKFSGSKHTVEERSQLIIEALKAMQEQMLEIQNRLSGLSFGETYIIDPNSSFSKEYEGISDEKFELVPPDDPVHSEYHKRQNPPTEKVLCRNKELRNRVVFIDCRALCRLSDLKKRPKEDY